MNTHSVLPIDISNVVDHALSEDIGTGDVTATHISSRRSTAADVLCREDAILCGMPWFNEVFHKIDRGISIKWHAAEGAAVESGTVVCSLHGNADSLLRGERTALNFLQTLSATATITHRYVEAVAGTATQILDTRKTLPGLRSAQKYAVRVGGGTNHRHGLYDGVLIKENHQIVSDSPKDIIDRLRGRVPDDFLIEVEIESIKELQDAIKSGANRIMLDNFSIADIAQAVRIADGRIELEASGNFNLKNVRAAAETGVDYISIGALTKNVRAIDLSMRFVEPGQAHP